MDKYLSLYRLVNGEPQPFPSADGQIILSSFTLTTQRMGAAPSITATVKYTQCLDGQWNDVFVTFGGERFFVRKAPDSEKNSTDDRYEHSVTFVSERSILDNIYMVDAVRAGDTADGYKSNDTRVIFSGDIAQWRDRLNAALEYAGLYDTATRSGYRAVVDEGISTEDRLVSFDEKYFSEALQEGFTAFGVPYYFVKNGSVTEIHLGFSEDDIDSEVKYGHDAALTGIGMKNSGIRTANRMSGYGSSDNIPYYYPNETPIGNGVSAEVTKGTGSTISASVRSNERLSVSIPRFPLTYGDGGFAPSGTTIQATIELTEKEVKPATTGLIFKGGSKTLENITVDVDAQSFVRISMDGVSWEVITERSIDTSQVVYRWESSVYSPSIDSITSAVMRSAGGTEYDVLNGAVLPAGTYDLTISFHVKLGKYIDSPRTYTTCTVSGQIAVMMDKGAWRDSSRREVDPYNVGITVTGVPAKGDTISLSATSRVEPINRLMPPIYRESGGTNRFYDAENHDPEVPGSGYPIPGTSPVEYYHFDNTVPENPKNELIQEFSDIKPTIAGMTNGSAQRIDMFLDVAFDRNDSDEKDEDGVYAHPYFFVKLPRTDGDYAFNLFDCALDTPMTLSMTSGACGACKFEISVDADTKKNTVQVDASGNLMRNADGDVICGRKGQGQVPFQPSQQDTSAGEVWIALKKDNSTFPSVMPSAPKIGYSGIRPSVGDTFVILNINMPQAYIVAAEQRLENAIIAQMALVNSPIFNPTITFSRIFLEQNADFLENLTVNSRLTNIAYNGTSYGFYILQMTYSMAEGEILPDVSVELVTELVASSNALDTRLEAMKQGILGSVAQSIAGIQYERVFLRKDVADTAAGAITFLDSIIARKDIRIGESGSYLLSRYEESGAEIGLHFGSADLHTFIEGAKLILRAGNATLSLSPDGYVGINKSDPEHTLDVEGDIIGSAGVAAGGITDPTSHGGGEGGTAYTLSGDIPSTGNLKLTLSSDDETLFPSSEVNISAEGLAEFVKSGTALKLRVTDANVWGAVSGHLLDDGKIKPTFLPDYILGQVFYGGSVNASGVCTLTQSFKDKYGVTALTLTAQNASLYEGVYFIASADGASGVPQALGVLTGDWIISNGTAWTKIDNTDAVTGVKGDAESVYRTGNINITKGNIGLGDVENTKLSTWAGSTNLTILGTVATGVWQGTPIADTYIASAGTWNATHDWVENNLPPLLQSLQSQIDSVATRDSFDNLAATSLFADMLAAGRVEVIGRIHTIADIIGDSGVAAGGITDPTSQGGGVTNYNDLDDRPLINGAILVGGESINLQPTISDLTTIRTNASAGKSASDNLNGHTVQKDVPADAKFTDTVYDDTALTSRVAAIETKDETYDAHVANTNNPHAVTKDQVGLDNVDNTADADKNVLSATKLTTARTLWGVSFDGSANITTAPDLYIGTTKVQTSSAPQNLTGIVTLATSGKVTIGGGGLDVTGDIIAHSNIVLGDSTSNRSLYAYYLENDPIQMVGYNPDQGRIHFGYGAWVKEKAVTLEGNTIQFLSAAGTSHTMNFDASGNLGINVATPQHRLDVGGDIFASAQIVGQTGVSAGGITDPTSSGGGGGSVDSISVNGSSFNPDASGVVTLPNYYTKTESDTKYATKTALQTTNIAVGALDTRLTADEANISGMSTDIYNLKGYFTNGKANDALKLGGVTAATFEDCIKSLQSQVDSISARDAFDELIAGALFADVLVAKEIHSDSLSIYATQSWVQDKHYVASIDGRHPDAQGYISVDGYFTDGYGSPTQDVYRLVLFGGGIELPFVNLGSTHTTNDWGLWSKSDVAQMIARFSSIDEAIAGKADASDLVNYLLKTEAASTYVTTQRYEADLDDFMEKRRSAVAGNIAVWEGTESYGADGSIKDSGTSLSSIESGLQSLQSQIDSVSSRDSFDELTATSLFADTFAANDVNARQVSSNSIYLSNLDGKVTGEIIPGAAGVTIWGINPDVDRYALYIGSQLLYEGNEVYHEGNLDFVLQSLQSQIDSVSSRDSFGELTATALFADIITANDTYSNVYCTANGDQVIYRFDGETRGFFDRLTIGNRELRGNNREEKNIAVRCTWMSNDPTSSTPGEMGDIAINDGYVGICLGLWYSGYLWIRLA